VCIFDFFVELKTPYQLVSIGVILSVLYVSNLTWPKIISRAFIAMGIGSFAIYLFNTSLIDLYYLFFRTFFELEIGIIFIISCLVISIVASILIRGIFNKVIPSKIYSL
jgi:peptidoglycan/LPS O-acetylase OafA/YrhL